MRYHLVNVSMLCVAMASASGAQAQTPAINPTTRDVHYTSRSVVRINARVRFTTMIILPEREEILDFVCGDKDFWIVSGGQNLAYVKPAKAGAMTNLNLVTASGRVYSFLLSEGSGEPDLKLYIEPDEGDLPTLVGAKRFYTADDVAGFKREAEDARRDADAARTDALKSADERVAKFRAAYPTGLRFPYRFKAHERPFNVEAIYTDGTFTYIRATPSELPSLYEVRDQAPNLVNFQVENGVYVVSKVLESGYLAIGKQRLSFETIR
jgi:type IV secretion system protein VirB9